MKSVWHKILRVDLSNNTCKSEQLSEEVYEKFLGGSGMSAYMLWRESPRGTTAFDPANRLTLAPGPMQGARQTGAGKWTGGAISPSINLNADSAATASFGIEIKNAGYDAIVTHGRAEKPVYVVVDDDRAEIKDASHLWGKNAYEAEDDIKEAEGEKFECVTIGQAGERLVRYANIQTRKKSFVGRCGLGAVMGSKLLKGVAVRGSQEVPVHDPEQLDKLNKEINKRLAQIDSEKPEFLRIYRVGTAMATEMFAPQGNLPIKNYQLATFPSGEKAFHGSNYAKELNAKPWPCKYCVLKCHNLCEIKEGPYAYKGKGPEYESFAMMGFDCLIDDVKAVAYAGELANMYSMDTISLGGVLAWAMESYEKGVITKEDTYGLDLTWGNAEAMVEMVKKIGSRADGLGYLLGEGSKIASERIGKGSEEWAIQMKGQEIAAHNWRAQYISALNYCTGVASGPNHERGNSQHIWVGHIRLPEWGIDEVENEERWSWENAADRNAKFHDYCNIINSACHCKFMEFRSYTLTDLLNTINACTGLGWTQEDLRRCGDRITQLQKLLNIRYGWKKEHDFNYPKRFMEPVDEGPAAGKIPVGLKDAIMDYYKVRGWDEDGKPTPAKLEEVGLEGFLE
ncbi:MAG: aldehyde ferredoxin oxidoreductase family protein [Desulfobacterales bacterium]|nr:aldehyde ferredoxin oxidoreductase family protein [Desulfobacterales bacterium]